MKLLVLAQTPPPLHGQSQMVEMLVEGLPSHGIEVRHVQMRLSRSSADIGRWRPGKILKSVQAALAARRVARLENCDAIYYVPAPAKRGALYRDLLIMGICRDQRRKLILHWHAVGLGEWLAKSATQLERTLALKMLGAADLSIALAPELVGDAEVLAPKRVAVVPNGISDPAPDMTARPPRSGPFEILFVGLGSREKGLNDTIEALEILNARRPGEFRMTFAGNFPGELEHSLFQRRAAALGGALGHAGFADEAKKRELFARADLFCFPTYYPHEGQPLSLIEALAHDLRVVTTRWRAIPGMLPMSNVWYVEPRKPNELAKAIEAVASAPEPAGAMRRHFLNNFTRERHLAAIAAALQSLSS
jgi:glycosyltransferase involved in cell wall biosynthesis